MPRKPKYAESRARYFIREQAYKRGWNLAHVSAGGDVLEENEIAAVFPDTGLGQNKPDFLFCIRGEPAAVIEAKNEAGKSAIASAESIAYANAINATDKYSVRVAIGASGTEDQGYIVVVRYLVDGEWIPLTASGFELTALPSKAEVEQANQAANGTTTVTVPTQAEFIDSAIEVSHILRLARVEAPLRPKVIGALVLAMYESYLGQRLEGDGEADPASNATVMQAELTLTEINDLVRAAIGEAVDLTPAMQADLVEALQLSGAAYQQLEPKLGRIIAILRRLNVRAVMHGGVDFLGTFYEAFLRYGYDNKALGIVFTPRHITRLCVDLAGVSHSDSVIDIAAGTGGFLVSAFDRMMESAPSAEARDKVRDSLHGFDTNPTVWALSVLNMYFRGDGKSNMRRASSLTAQARTANKRRFSRSFLNPPFSQSEEPERQFLDAAIEACRPDGLLAAVVKAGIFADDDHKSWRAEFTRRHSVLAIISNPDDLFYPTASPTSILVARPRASGS